MLCLQLIKHAKKFLAACLCLFVCVCVLCSILSVCVSVSSILLMHVCIGVLVWFWFCLCVLERFIMLLCVFNFVFFYMCFGAFNFVCVWVFWCGKCGRINHRQHACLSPSFPLMTFSMTFLDAHIISLLHLKKTSLPIWSLSFLSKKTSLPISSVSSTKKSKDKSAQYHWL